MTDRNQRRIWQCHTGARYETTGWVDECPCGTPSGGMFECTSTVVDVPADGQYDVAPDGTVITAPATLHVLQLLRWNPDGVCRQDFARHDHYEPSSRIGVLKNAGYTIAKRPCTRHHHRPGSGIVEYRLGGWPT